MKIHIALIALLLLAPAMAQDSQPISDSLSDPEGDVIKQEPQSGNDEEGNPLPPKLEPGSGNASEIDIVNVRALRLGNNITMTMELAGKPVGTLTGDENITQIAYMMFLEDLAPGAEPSSKTGTIGNWAEVVRCSIQLQGNLTCVAVKANLRIVSQDVGEHAVVVTAEIFDETMFQHIGVGGFTLLFQGTQNDTAFMLDLTKNLDVQNAPDAAPADGARGFTGLISDTASWMFGFPQVLFLAAAAALGVGSYMKRRQEAETATGAAPVQAVPVPGAPDAGLDADTDVSDSAAPANDAEAGDDRSS